eukprot:Gb_17745 [translate_table: standard]
MPKAATSSIGDENYIGMGAENYIGILVDEQEVAINLLRDEVREEIRTVFIQKCKMLVQLKHRNVAWVLGWCESLDFVSVVMEFLGNGTLENWLLDSNSPPSWP